MRPLPSIGLVLVLALASFTPSAARALYGDETPAPAPTWRVELVGPSLGIGVFLAPAASYERNIVSLSGELRFAHRTGHGALFRMGWGSNLWGGGWVGELAYLHRFRLVGHDAMGVGLDLSVGPTLAALRHDEGTVPAGNALGGHVGVSLDGRIHGLTISLAGQYRVFVPWRGPPNGGPVGPEHALTLMVGLGLAFYG